MIRRYVLFVVSLLTLFGSLTAAAATLETRNYMLRGYSDATRDHNLPFRQLRLGVNVDLRQYDSAALRDQFSLMQQANIVWLRQFIYWDDIEIQQGQFDWAVTDRLVDAVAAQTADLRLVLVLMNSPAWSRGSGDSTAPPDNPDDFIRFARQVALRYADRVDYYQIWDEPNLSAAWGGLQPRPAQYAAMLRGAKNAIHSADPNATVIAAALAPTTEQGPENISDLRYLRDLYALGLGAFADAIAAKPYGFDTSPLDRDVNAEMLNFSRLVALREIMLENDDGEKALWASNWGWNSLPDTWTGNASIWGSVSSEQQRDYTLQALDRAEREWPWLGGMILQHWQPDATPDDPQWGFALVDQTGIPGTLWSALAERSDAAVASNGLYMAANPFASYSGVWTFGPLGADIGWINDSTARFDFSGRDIALLLRQDNYVAYLYPTVDGHAANATPLDVGGNAYILLTSDTRLPTLNLVPVSRDLAPGEHHLTLKAVDLVPEDAEDRWALVGYGVSSGDLAAPYNQQLLVALISTAVGFLAALVTGLGLPWPRLLGPLTALWRGVDNVWQILFGAITSLALMLGLLLSWGNATPVLFRRDPVQLGLAIISGGLIYLQPGLLLTLLCLAVLFVLFYARPEIGLALTLFWSPFFLFPIELYNFLFPMAEILVLLTFAAALLSGLVAWGRMRQSQISNYPSVPIWASMTALDWGMVAWLVLGILSLSWTRYLDPASTELRTVMVEPALFYLVIRLRPARRKTALLLVDALLAAGIAVALIGLLQYVRGEAVITAEDGVRRLAGVYGSPNNLGLFLGRCLPFALAYALAPLDRRRRSIAVVALTIMALALLLSMSAGALFVGLPLSIITVLLLTGGRRTLRPLVMLIAVGGATFVLALRSARFARLVDFSGGTNFIRLRVWHSALNMLRDYPITGIGLDQFLYLFRGAYISPDAWEEPNLSHPHNILLDFWLRLGVMGVVLLIYLQALFWGLARRLYLQFRDSDALLLALIIGIMGSMVNLMGHGLVDNSVFVNDLAYVFVLLLALVNMLSRLRT